MKNALGIIETVGLAAAIEAADTAVKSANVRLIGYELTKGDGMATVKFEGDVGAVKAGIESARSSASLVNKVFSFSVIPRPNEGLEMFIGNRDTVGCAENKTDVEIEAGSEDEADAETEVESKDELDTGIKTKTDAESENEIKIESEIEAAQDITLSKAERQDKAVCNLCHDPNCTRKKGEQRRFCIHYFDHGR
ncbi:BMC domain-containing protein [Fusibacter ferrireducens]|uniref:BMC domain-containing protein n=1 Tax=Fusibacter ferrireducens TaxID=2785058 RepID=A0ABS0A0G1_9FIRM|nr:BMC domain-containing protein [Fusibacter ferrireducens]MBF4695928.1 BMC domain-containing protein [Fusibacter ferrireducens]